MFVWLCMFVCVSVCLYTWCFHVFVYLCVCRHTFGFTIGEHGSTPREPSLAAPTRPSSPRLTFFVRAGFDCLRRLQPSEVDFCSWVTISKVCRGTQGRREMWVKIKFSRANWGQLRRNAFMNERVKLSPKCASVWSISVRRLRRASKLEEIIFQVRSEMVTIPTQYTSILIHVSTLGALISMSSFYVLVVSRIDPKSKIRCYSMLDRINVELTHLRNTE
jgi:hypothetical protein